MLPRPRALWFAILVGPLVWLGYLEAAYAVVASACAGGRGVLVPAGAVAAAMVVAAGAVVARRSLAAVPVDARDAMAERTRFLAVLGLWMSVLFIFVIVATAVPSLVLPPCD
jgi:hypothetical protein